MNKTFNKKNKLTKYLRYVIIAFATIAFVFLFMRFVAFHAYVPSESMEPTLNVGDHYIVSRVSFYTKAPQRGDIVIFRNSGKIDDDDDTNYVVKRIIGVGGDVVIIQNGNVYINDKLFKEDYAEKDDYSGKFEVPDGCYFLMGDNRDESNDSRYWDNPYLKREDILGKGVFRFYPQPKKLR